MTEDRRSTPKTKPQAKSQAIRQTTASPPLHRILIIEDSPTMLAVCCNTLSLVGFECDPVADAEQGWQKLVESLNAERYSALLLDWILPGMNGETLLTKIEQDERFNDLAVMIFTETPNQGLWEMVVARPRTDIQLKDELEVLPQRMLRFLEQKEDRLLSTVLDQTELKKSNAISNETILLVDDSATVRLRYSSLLREAGYTVIEANGFVEGLNLARQEKPNLAIIDFYMPDGNGDKLCQELTRCTEVDLSMVLFSQRKDMIEIALAAGAIDLLFKDDPTHIFLMRINALMAVIRSERNNQQLDLLVWVTQEFGFGIMKCSPQGYTAENFLMEIYQVEVGGLNLFDTQSTFEKPLSITDLSGATRYFVVHRYSFNDQEYMVVAHEITHIKRAEQAEISAKNEAESAKRQLELLFNSAGEGILGVNLQGDINFSNPKASMLLEIDHQALLLRTVQSFFVLNEANFVSLKQFMGLRNKAPQGLFSDWQIYQIAEILNCSAQNEKAQCNYWKTAHGKVLYAEYSCNPTLDAEGNCVGAVIMFQDITKRKALEDQLLRLANFDPLTGLSNRTHFHITLTQAIERQKHTDKSLAVLYLDMDHFKYINDSLGHDSGDECLTQTAKLLRHSVRAGDLVSRLGGDEFAAVLFDINGEEDAAYVAKKILSALNEPLILESEQVHVSFSIGIALLSDELTSFDDLMKAADTAMYVAKNEGRNQFKHYQASMQEEAEQKQRIQTLLQLAIPQNEFSLLYQPKVSLETQQLIGCEALLRWNPTHSEPVSPALFIPHAEDSGQIIEIGEWVLKKACEQVQKWLSELAFNDLVVSINVSTRQLGRGTFYPLLQHTLHSTNVPASAIELEITETGVMDNLDIVIDELQKIHDLGVKISIDDFGTGNSSLELLRKLPLDCLKIDRSFVMDIGNDPKDEEIIRVMLAVAETLGLEVVAEGAETVEQIVFLSSSYCEVIQGYYFSKPVTAAEFAALVESSNPFTAQFSCYDEVITKFPAPQKIIVEATSPHRKGL